MKRRQVIQSILSLPAITALPAAAQHPPQDLAQASAPEKPAPRADETLKLATTSPEAVAAPAPRFFSPAQFGTLERLCDILFPSADPKPGAKQAGVAEFLDFLIGRSPRERQSLYGQGLDRLDSGSHSRFDVSFAEASPAQAAELLAPLRTPWTFEGPSGELARFLVAAKDDVLRATVNSREWAAASTGRRGGSGIGTYWYSLE